jgi:uncharacterized hydrophobic protein (TIGR00271 family)
VRRRRSAERAPGAEALVRLRIIAAPGRASRALEVLHGNEAVTDLVHFRGAAHRPAGDVILCDIERDQVTDVVSDLRDLGLDRDGSISLQHVETAISARARRNSRSSSEGIRAVVWEQVDQYTSQSAELSVTYLVFMVLATLIASAGIYLNTDILIVGAMILGPDFGPIAGVCVGIVERRPDRAARSALALVAGFTLAILVAYAASVVFRATGLTAADFVHVDNSVASAISRVGFFTLFVALLAGVAGVLSLTTARSGALIGVLVSVTTIPAAATMSVAAAYGHGSTFREALAQLAINIGAMLLAGTLTLAAQRRAYRRHRAAHVGETSPVPGARGDDRHVPLDREP